MSKAAFPAWRTVYHKHPIAYFPPIIWICLPVVSTIGAYELSGSSALFALLIFAPLITYQVYRILTIWSARLTIIDGHAVRYTEGILPWYRTWVSWRQSQIFGSVHENRGFLQWLFSCGSVTIIEKETAKRFTITCLKRHIDCAARIDKFAETGRHF